MLNSLLLLKGFIVGFTVAMPIGAVDILCIRNSLAWGKRYGLATGLGVATADGICAALAGFSLMALTTWLISNEIFFKLFGGLFLLFIGYHIFQKKSEKRKKQINACEDASTMAQMFLTTLVITLTNPLTILTFAGIFAGLGLATENGSLQTALMLASGVFLGSMLWWIVLTCSATYFKDTVNGRRLIWLNRLSGIVLIIFGLFALSTLL